MKKFSYRRSVQGFLVIFLVSSIALSCNSSLKVRYLYPSSPTKTVQWFNYCLNNILSFKTFQKLRDVLDGRILDEFNAIEKMILHNVASVSDSSNKSSKKSAAIYVPKAAKASASEKAKLLYFKKDIKLFIENAKKLKIQFLKIATPHQQTKELSILAYFYYESGLKPDSKRIDLIYKQGIWKIKSIQSVSDSITAPLWPK